MLAPFSRATGISLGGAFALSLVVWLSACTTAVIDHQPIPCGPETCDGCCSASGLCLKGTSPFACGEGGLACSRCGPSESCSAGVCGSSPDPDSDGGVSSACGPSTCAGCCQNGECIDLRVQTAPACGLGGGACSACEGDDVCVLGACERVSGCRLVLNRGTGVIDFGVTTVGTDWGVRFELENEGIETCEVSAPAWISGADTRAFHFSGDALTSFSIPPGGRSQFTVSFSPYVVHDWEPEKNAFTFVVSDRAPSQCANPTPGCRHIPVRGSAIPSNLPPVWSVLPGTLELGDVAVGCDSVRRAAMVVNVSPEPIRIENAAVYGAGLALTDSRGLPIDFTQGLVIPGWGTARLYVTFSPQAEGAVQGRLKVLVGNDERNFPVRATAVRSAPLTFRTVQQPPGDLDLLFVVHTGKEMEWIQSELRAAAPEIVARLTAATGTFHAGVFNTDATRDTSGSLQGSPRFVVPGQNASLALERNLGVGTGGSTPDQSLEALRLALIPPNVNSANAGFLRDQSRLAVVVVTNADERSGAAVDDYRHALYGAKGGGIAGAQRARIFGLTTADACASGDRYGELLTSATGGCHVISPGTIGAALNDILDQVLQPRNTFILPGPMADLMSVRVDGVEVPRGTGFVDDPWIGMIRFLPGYVPEQGQQIDITWSPHCRPNP